MCGLQVVFSIAECVISITCEREWEEFILSSYVVDSKLRGLQPPLVKLYIDLTSQAHHADAHDRHYEMVFHNGCVAGLAVRYGACRAATRRVRYERTLIVSDIIDVMLRAVRIVGTIFHTMILSELSLIHIWRCRRSYACRSRWSPYH